MSSRLSRSGSSVFLVSVSETEIEPTEDCPTEFCTCRDVENDPDFIACENQMKAEYIACVDLCQPGDYPCLALCNREYDEKLKNCPCKENCPLGCPCPDYTCDASTTQATTTTAMAPSTATSTPATTQ